MQNLAIASSNASSPSSADDRDPGQLAGFQSYSLIEAKQDAVLVALADPSDRQGLTDALVSEGCRILLAANAESALEIANTRQPSLIILGRNLPEKDGFRACNELRDGIATRHIPVIMLSQRAGAGEKMRALQQGAVDYITGPFDWAEVAAQVCSQIKLERLRGELAVANRGLLAKQAQHHAGLKAAAGIQQSLLPSHSSEEFDGLSVAWKFLPLEQVGGDLLGYAWLDEDHLAAYVVDVCGHGLPAAMMTAAISTSLAPNDPDERRGLKRRPEFSPREILERLDHEYPLERFDRPFTIAYLVLNRRTGEFRCSRAGHPMPIVIRRGGQLDLLESGGTIIGLDRMLPFDEGSGKLNRGDSILLYSDGVTECAGTHGTFGLERLAEILAHCSELPPASICDTIVQRLLNFNRGIGMRDDVTMLALSYSGECGTADGTSAMPVVPDNC